MKHLILACTLFLGLAFGWPIPKIEPLIFKLRTDSGQCSAVAVGPKQLYATVAHCFVDVDEIGYLDDANRVHVLEWDQKEDIAILQGAFSGTNKYMKVGKEPKRGDDVLGVGFGQNSPKIIFKGFLWEGPIAIPGQDGLIEYLLSEDAVGGMSGGPIVNRKGELVGLVRGSYRFPDSAPIGYTTTYGVLKEMIERNQKDRLMKR